MKYNNSGILAVIGSSVAIFMPGALTFGYPGVMGAYWQETFHVGKSAVGNCLFFLLAMVGIFMFLAGKLQERFGSRALIRTGAVICPIAVVIAAYAVNIYMVYLWAMLNGIAVSLIYIPGLTTVQKWFPHKKGLVSGIVNLSFGISAAVMAPIFAALLGSQGYRLMNLEMAVLALVLGLIAAQFAQTPERVENRPAGSAAASQPARSPEGFSLSEAVKTKSFWSLWLVWALMGAASISMVTLSIGFGVSRGFTIAEGILILTAFNLTSGLSRIVIGPLSDRLGRRALMSIAFFLAGFSWLGLVWAGSLPLISVLAMLVGIAFGTLFVCSAPLVTDCFGMKQFGSIFGLVFTAYGFIAGIIGPSLCGFILDSTKSYVGIFIYLGILSILSGLIIHMVRPPVRHVPATSSS